MTQQVLAILTALLVSITAQSKELKGVSFPDEVKVGTATLKLNGLGVRKAFSMFDVYIAALYLNQPLKDPAAIVQTDTPKQIVMHFMRFVEKGKLRTAWNEGF